MYDLSIIKSSLDKNKYNNISKYIDVKDLTQELSGLYRVVELFHSEHEGTLTCDDLANFFFATQPKDKDFYIGFFENLKTIECSDESALALAKSLKRASVLRKLAETSYEASEGKEKPYEAVKALYGQLEELDNISDEQTSEWEIVTDDLHSLIDTTVNTPGLRWRLSSLNHHLGSIRKGDFGFVFARPETGKTTFLASEISFMAEQAKKQGLGPVLHINNEEGHEKVKLRYYQATLGATLEQLHSNETASYKTFQEKVGGYILIPKVTTYHRKDVERLCEQLKPGLLIFDQIDKITGFDNDRDDLKLGAIYQWARELPKEYCPTIGICQADGSGEGVKWLTMGNVANAKTSKQAEADFILGIGAVHDPGYEKLRFFHLSKNKLLGDLDTKGERHARWECLIDPS